MNIEHYQLKSGLELLSYEFVSEGPKGFITKRIQFTLVNRQGVYNLAFGDKDPVTGEIDDKVVSNNGDSEKVLATVVGAVFAFLDSILTHGFLQQEALLQGQDFIRWELLNIMTK